MSRSRIDWRAADPWADLLGDLRMSGVFHCECELRTPWCLTLPPMPGCLWFHHVATGGAEWSAEPPSARAASWRALAPGDFLLVPHGRGHWLRGGVGAAAANVLELPHVAVHERHARLRHGGSGPAALLLCGVVRFDDLRARDLLRHLPASLRLGAGGGTTVRHALSLMVAELEGAARGSHVVVARLADILVIQTIRAWLDDAPAAREGFFAAARDRQLGRAIAAMHREPSQGWTVEALAREAALSRSAFAARFSRLLGAGPIEYLQRLRLHRAHDRLLQPGPPRLAELAAEAGYGSEAAFSRAFKRALGVAPGSLAAGGGARRPR